MKISYLALALVMILSSKWAGGADLKSECPDFSLCKTAIDAEGNAYFSHSRGRKTLIRSFDRAGNLRPGYGNQGAIEVEAPHIGTLPGISTLEIIHLDDRQNLWVVASLSDYLQLNDEAREVLPEFFAERFAGSVRSMLVRVFDKHGSPSAAYPALFETVIQVPDSGASTKIKAVLPHERGFFLLYENMNHDGTDFSVRAYDLNGRADLNFGHKGKKLVTSRQISRELSHWSPQVFVQLGVPRENWTDFRAEQLSWDAQGRLAVTGVFGNGQEFSHGDTSHEIYEEHLSVIKLDARTGEPISISPPTPLFMDDGERNPAQHFSIGAFFSINHRNEVLVATSLGADQNLAIVDSDSGRASLAPPHWSGEFYWPSSWQATSPDNFQMLSLVPTQSGSENHVDQFLVTNFRASKPESFDLTIYDCQKILKTLR